VISIALQTTGDIINYSLVAATGFFLAVAFGLLYRYRQASQRLNESTDLGHDLWQALDQRMKKQDERIVDLMVKVEVLQARAMSVTPVTSPMSFPASPSPSAPPVPTHEPGSKPVQETKESAVAEPHPMTTSQPATPSHPESQPKSEPIPQIIPTTALPAPVMPKQIKLDSTSRAALELLKQKPLTTEDLWKGLDKGREHTSRVMKKLFELGLVTRDEADKPYTYQLTEEGRRNLGQTS
jgi:DNA-binding transcriptional ArsR family regulator